MGKKKLVGDITLHIAAALAARKDELRWSYDKIAEASGVTKPTVVYALKGEQSIAVESYVALCGALGLDAGRLLNDAVARRSAAPDLIDFTSDYDRLGKQSYGVQT